MTTWPRLNGVTFRLESAALEFDRTGFTPETIHGRLETKDGDTFDTIVGSEVSVEPATAPADTFLDFPALPLAETPALYMRVWMGDLAAPLFHIFRRYEVLDRV